MGHTLVRHAGVISLAHHAHRSDTQRDKNTATSQDYLKINTTFSLNLFPHHSSEGKRKKTGSSTYHANHFWCQTEEGIDVAVDDEEEEPGHDAAPDGQMCQLSTHRQTRKSVT